MTLFRCNGKHGIYNHKGFNPESEHFDFHIHRATAKAQELGAAIECEAEKTEEFASFEEALQMFVRSVSLNAVDCRKYFKSENQYEMFRDDEPRNS